MTTRDQQIAAAVIEAAAKICDIHDMGKMEARFCAQQIRALDLDAICELKMSCTCEGYAEPTLGEKVIEFERNYKELYDCHQKLVSKYDKLKVEHDKLKATYGELRFRMDGLEK